MAALSGPVDAGRLERGLAALARLGFEPVPADNLAERDRQGLFAGDDETRLAAFHRLASDRSIEAVLFARGGWGALRLLPRIDWALLAERPRAWVGYSDLTPFLAAVGSRLGLVAFHGPMVAADLARGLTPAEEASLLAALAGEPAAELAVEVVAAADEPAVEGPLAGGCLSLLASLVGTPYYPPVAGSVLFLEDVDEPLYRLDRMLTHLRLSGSLTGVRAVVFGHLDCRDAPLPDPPGDWLTTLRDDLGPGGPTLAWGLAAGHRAPNLTLPLGWPARLDPAEGVLSFGGG